MKRTVEELQVIAKQVVAELKLVDTPVTVQSCGKVYVAALTAMGAKKSEIIDFDIFDDANLIVKALIPKYSYYDA